MKSYTDLEQSKKLAEILPIESADMFWYLATKGNPVAGFNEGYNKYGDFELPCWSLAALLNVLPNDEHIEASISRGGYKLDPIEYMPNTWWCIYEDTKNQTDFNTSADNPVDACYEMILKLNKLNLL